MSLCLSPVTLLLEVPLWRANTHTRFPKAGMKSSPAWWLGALLNSCMFFCVGVCKHICVCNSGAVRQHGEILLARKVQLFYFIRASCGVKQVLSILADSCFYDASTPSVFGQTHNWHFSLHSKDPQCEESWIDSIYWETASLSCFWQSADFMATWCSWSWSGAATAAAVLKAPLQHST